MALLYPGTAVSGYNANPPPDDGSTGTNNLIQWAGIKNKIGDPLNTFATTADSNITSAFAKTLDGSGIAKTSGNYPMSAADQGRLIVATASGITLTTPDAGTVGAPFVFAINNQSTGSITLAGNATNAQTVDGQTSQTIGAGAGCLVKTDGTNWFTYGLRAAQITAAGSNYGFDSPVNLSLTASVNSNILTVAVKTVAGNDPSAGDPVLIGFRDATKANGDPVWVSVTSALSINTNATGATLSTQSTVPFRFWVLAFNNAGTVVLALWNSGATAASPAINDLSEWALQSTTGISGAATSAGVFYTPNGTNLTNKAFRIIGFLEYESGLATAGTYSSVPTRLQLFGPGIPRPGSIIKEGSVTVSSGTTSTGATKTATNLTVSPTLTSVCNMVDIDIAASGMNSSSGTACAQLGRNSSSNLIGPLVQSNSTGFSLIAMDQPSSLTPTYTMYIFNNAAGGNATWPSAIGSQTPSGTLRWREMMG